LKGKCDASPIQTKTIKKQTYPRLHNYHPSVFRKYSITSTKPHLLRLEYHICIILVFFVFLGTNSSVMAAEKDESVAITKHLSLGIKVKRLFDSHTTYEFGNPFSPFQAPLSRLEFPLNVWWGGIELRFSTSRFSIGGEVLRNALGDSDGRMRDTDWDDDTKPALETIYSESRCRMEPSYMVRIDADLEVSDWLGLPSWLSLRPVIGFRYQNFHMVTHDGVEYTWDGSSPTYILTGNTLRFKQTYWHYFGGLRLTVDAAKYAGKSDLLFFMQFYWAYVEGSNEDNHLLRPGKRFTYENTFGYAWHTSVGVKKGISKNLFLGLEAEHLRISTTGSHRLVNEPMGTDFGFSHGVKVWSEQTSISLKLEYLL